MLYPDVQGGKQCGILWKTGKGFVFAILCGIF